MRNFFLKPRITKIKNINSNFSEITLKPLESGYGNTIGNVLRRILLSSLGGYCATKLSILNVNHEYSYLKGVKEDILDIMLNIRGLIFKVSDNIKKFFIYLNKNTPGIILASDIFLPYEVEILNPNHVIANLNIGVSLNMRIKVEKGRGFVESYYKKTKKKKSKNVGRFFLDAYFSPIRRVFYKIKTYNIKKQDIYEKLIISIETNGSITPEDALKKTINILIRQFSFFIKFKKKKFKKIKNNLLKKFSINSFFLKSVEYLDLTVRSSNCLRSERIFYIGDLIQKSEDRLLKTPNFGKKSLEEIKNILKKYKLKLNTKIKNWKLIKKKNIKKK